ncbi:MAG: phage tail sheath protein FI, partial [Crocinitomix sp.]
GPDDLGVDVYLNTDNSVDRIEFSSSFCLYDSMRMFYSNGGGPCYIVSVGSYETATANYFTNLTAGVETLRKEDEPTLILFPDAVTLSNANKALLGTLQKTALKQCNDLQDRFCIFDLLNGGIELNVSDVDGETPDKAFRNNIGVQYLKYGASYYPNLKTTLSFEFGYENISKIEKSGAMVSLSAISIDPTYVDHLVSVIADSDEFKAYTYDPGADTIFTATSLLDVAPINAEDVYNGFGVIGDFYGVTSAAQAKNQVIAKIEYMYFMLESFVTMVHADIVDEDLDGDGVTKDDLNLAHEAMIDTTDSRVYDILKKLHFYNGSYSTKGTTAVMADVTDLGVVPATGALVNFAGTITVTYVLAAALISDATLAADSIYGDGSAPATQIAIAAIAAPALQELYEEIASLYRDYEATVKLRKDNLELLIQDTNSIYSNIVTAVNKEGLVLPPSGAVAGIYAATDNERGVWVAPANRSLNSVVGPSVSVDAADQSGLNVDVTAGKSINAIRSFTGKGTLIWGARTLAGNSNEWRYIPVRRLFNMIEESVKKATEFVVFEPNDKNTWVRSKAMIDNFLNSIWKAGGLAGAKPEHAYIVKVGLGETMTAQDILEGKMIVEIHLAAVRPAEFIILRFMHKLQES